jgi:hypothetical protein
MKTLIAFCILFINLSTANASNCPVTADPCDQYLDCVEADFPCGDKGYAQAYGHFYCLKFSDANFSYQISEDWRDATRTCLLGELLKLDFQAPQLTCEKIKSFAFNSHPRCYLNPDPKRPKLSICYLPKLDILRVSSIVSVKDAMGKLGRKQIQEVAQVCLSNLFKIKNNRSGQKEHHHNNSPVENVDSLIEFWKTQLK